jgi:hypothetical protein
LAKADALRRTQHSGRKLVIEDSNFDGVRGGLIARIVEHDKLEPVTAHWERTRPVDGYFDPGIRGFYWCIQNELSHGISFPCLTTKMNISPVSYDAPPRPSGEGMRG